MRFLTLLLLASFAFLSTGCLWGKKKPKNESHIYGGNAPGITFTKRQERAGGSLQTY